MNGNTVQTRQKRILYLDYLRIFATIGVILLHVTAQNWDVVELQSYEWNVFFVFNCGVSWPVNMFMMISGALFLDPDRPLSLKKLYRGNILRIVTAFVFWSAVYAADQLLSGAGLRALVQAFLQGHFHMWFLTMIVTYYIMTPVLRKITADKKLTEYFLVIVFLWAILLPCILQVLNYLQLPHATLLAEVLSYHNSVGNFGFQRTFLFYYVLGVYLTKYDAPVPVRIAMPVLGLGGYLVRVIFSAWHVRRTGSVSIPFDFLLCNLAMGVGAFLLGKYVLSRIRLSERGTKLLCTLSNYSFGVYLSHILVMDKLEYVLGLHTLTFDPIFSVPAVLVCVVVLCYLISAVLHKIPVLKKFVV